MYTSYNYLKKFWIELWLKVEESLFNVSNGVSLLLVGIDRRLCRYAAIASSILKGFSPEESSQLS